MLKRLLSILSILVLLLVGEGLAAERRVALVVGNAEYTGTARLANTINDAEAVAERLRGLDFDVTLATDLDGRSIISAIDAFSRNSAGADIAFLFYAGHGIQIGSESFLLPVDVDVSSERSLRYSAIDIQEVVGEMERAAEVAVVVLDACRDNPYLEALSRSAAGTRSVRVSRGLGALQLSGRGAIIAYAAAAGEVASDGGGNHSPYTAALLEEIDQQGVEVGLMFRRVAGRVIDTTRGAQRPELLVRLVDEVYLRPSPKVVAAQVPLESETVVPDTPKQTEQESETQVAAADTNAGNGNGRSTSPHMFFGERIIRKPTWAAGTVLPEPPDWQPAPARSVSETAGNDSYGTAQPVDLAATVQSQITPRGDNDWYRVVVPIAGELSVGVDQAPAELDLFARVWNAERQVVADWQGAGRAGGELDARFPLPAPGEYRIQLSDGRNDADSGAGFDLELDFRPANDPLEPNNAISAAKAIPLPANFRPAIYPRGDNDWYRIWIPSPGLLTVITEEVPEDLDISIRLWGLDGNVIRDWAQPPRKGGDTYFEAELAVPGVYAIEMVDGRSDSSDVRTFSLSAEFLPVGDETEPNNSFGAAAQRPNSGLQRIAIFPRGDTDWLAIDVDHPGQLEIFGQGIPTEIDLHARVWSANKDVIRDWIKPYRQGGDLEGFADLSKPGRYFIEIADGRSDASSPELFDLTLTFTPQFDQNEPNNAMSAAAPLTTGGEIAFNILPRGDTDWFGIEAPSQGELFVTIDEGPENLDLHYRVWNTQRQVIRDWVAPYRKGGLTEGFVDLPGPGTYFLELSDGRSDERSIEHATLKTVFTPTEDPLEPNNSYGQARPFPVGQSHLAHILPRGDADWYLLDAPRPGAFLVTVEDVDKALDIHVRLWDAEGSAGSWVGPPRPGGLTDARLPVEKAGLYRLELVDGRGDARSPVPFRVSVQFE